METTTAKAVQLAERSMSRLIPEVRAELDRLESRLYGGTLEAFEKDELLAASRALNEAKRRLEMVLTDDPNVNRIGVQQ